MAQTTITINESVKDALEEEKPDRVSWNEWLMDLADAPGIPSRGYVEETTPDNVTKEDIERLEDRLDHLPERIADEMEGRLR